MNDASARLFAIALTATWCGFGLYGVVRKLGLSPQAREMLRRFRQARLSTKAALAAGLLAAVAVGGTKPGGTNDPPRGMRPPAASRDVRTRPEAASPAFAPVEVRMNNVSFRAESASAVEVEDWRRHGSSSGGVWLDFGAPVFRIGTNPVSRAHVAASGVLSFDSIRRPPVGAPLPDGTGLPALVPFLAPLGMVPEANWTNAGAASRFWHDTAPGRSRVLTWEEALLDRLPGRRVSVQAELQPSGDFTYRYDFADALDPPATNLVIGAQVGTNGVNALAILGTNLLTETVWRVDGARVTNGVSIADLLCTNGVLRTPARFAIEWMNTSGIDSNADADGDGLSDWDEVFLHGTDPAQSDTDGDGLPDGAEILAGANLLDADEDGDGVPDGFSPADWGAHPLWATNSADGANMAVTLFRDIPQGEAATLLVGTLPLPLRSAGTRELRLPAGEAVPFRLFATRGAAPSLGLSPPASGLLDPVFLDDPGGVFHVSRPPNRLDASRPDPPPPPESRPGQGTLCVIAPRFFNADTLVEAPPDECVHDLDGTSRYRLKMAEGYVVEIAPDFVSPPAEPNGEYVLAVSTCPGDWAEAYASFENRLVWGTAHCSVRIHRCTVGHAEWCSVCHLWHHPGERCPHADNCAAKTNASASCTCPEFAIRADPGGDHDIVLGLTRGTACCCPPEDAADFVRILEIPAFATLLDSDGGVLQPLDEVEEPVTLRIAETGGMGELRYAAVLLLKDASGAVTNEMTRPGTMKLWGIDMLFEPVTTETVGVRSVNPCGILLGGNALFRLQLSPTNFPSASVSWEASPANRVSFPSGTNGTEVVVHGDAAGDVTLAVHIAGYAGPSPICEAKVVPETVIPVHAFIICSTNGTPVTTTNRVASLLAGANEIYTQVGRRFELESCLTITNEDWLSVPKLNGRWPKFHQIINHTNGTNGIEMYFNQTIVGANGLTNPNGVLIANSGNANTVAHELGHAQGLPDIYVSRPSITNIITGAASRTRIPADWGSPSDEGYYPAGIQQSAIIPRLLMSGVELPTKRDIPLGNIYGLWYSDSYSEPVHQSAAPLGFFTNAFPHPVSN